MKTFDPCLQNDEPVKPSQKAETEELFGKILLYHLLTSASENMQDHFTPVPLILFNHSNITALKFVTGRVRALKRLNRL